MYIISELVDILNKISDVNIWKYRQVMFVAEYWIDSGQVALAWRWRHPDVDRPQEAGHIYIGYRKYLYHISNGCSSSENMHVIVEVICGSTWCMNSRLSVIDCNSCSDSFGIKVVL